MTPDTAHQTAHVTVKMTIIRADGTIEEMGVVSETPVNEPGAVERLRNLFRK